MTTRQKINSIKKSFSSAATSYDSNSSFQMETARIVAGRAAELFSGRSPKTILDVGSGTGHLTGLLSEKFPDSTIVALDIALPMLRVMTGKQKPVLPVNACFESLPLRNRSFDLIISNLSYQWTKSPEKAFIEVTRTLRPGGMFIAHTLGPENFSELRDCLSQAGTGNKLPKPASHPDPSLIKSVLKGCKLTDIEIKRTPVKWSYSSPTRFLKTINSIGANPAREDGARDLSSGTALRRVLDLYKKNHSNPDGSVHATYDLVTVRFRKPPTRTKSASPQIHKKKGGTIEVPPAQSWRRF